MAGILYSIVDGYSGLGEVQAAANETPVGVFWWRIHEAFISLRCISIFSLLFGLGLWQQWQRAIDTRRSYVGPHLRRMACLIAFGIINTTFFFSAEILMVYAVLGMLILAIHRVKVPLPAVLFIASLSFLVLGPLWDIKLMGPGMPGAREAFEQIYPPERVTAIYQEGGLGESIKLRWFRYGMIYYNNGEWMRMGLTMVLLGYAAGRSGVGERLFRQPLEFRIAGTLVALPGCIFMLAGLGGFPTYATIHDGPFYFLVSSGLILSTLTLIWLFALICKTQSGEFVVKVFSPVGRQSLTTYVGGAAVFAVIFQHYGLSLYGKLHYPIPTYVAMVTYAALALFAHFWQHRYQQGPLEWLWRRLTYDRTDT